MLTVPIQVYLLMLSHLCAKEKLSSLFSVHLVLRHLRNNSSGREVETMLRKVPQALNIYLVKKCKKDVKFQVSFRAKSGMKHPTGCWHFTTKMTTSSAKPFSICTRRNKVRTCSTRAEPPNNWPRQKSLCAVFASRPAPNW